MLDSRGHQILTPREEQVVALVAESLSNRDIAHELNLSEHSVKKYLFRIFDKLGISSRVELSSTPLRTAIQCRPNGLPT
jgi:DNA-binding NarL/FixJ family response regulator